MMLTSEGYFYRCSIDLEKRGRCALYNCALQRERRLNEKFVLQFHQSKYKW